MDARWRDVIFVEDCRERRLMVVMKHRHGKGRVGERKVTALS